MKLHRLKFFFSLVISCNPQLGRQIINRNHLVTSALNVITTPTIALELCSTYLGQISPWLAHCCVMTSQKWWHGSVYDVTRLQKSQIFHQWCNCSYNSILTEFAVAGKSMNSGGKVKAHPGKSMNLGETIQNFKVDFFIMNYGKKAHTIFTSNLDQLVFQLS